MYGKQAIDEKKVKAPATKRVMAQSNLALVTGQSRVIKVLGQLFVEPKELQVREREGKREARNAVDGIQVREPAAPTQLPE